MFNSITILTTHYCVTRIERDKNKNDPESLEMRPEFQEGYFSYSLNTANG